MKIRSKIVGKIFNYFTPKLKERILQRIVLSVTNAHIKNWESQTLQPLHQKLVRLEMEIKKLKKNKK